MREANLLLQFDINQWVYFLPIKSHIKYHTALVSSFLNCFINISTTSMSIVFGESLIFIFFPFLNNIKIQVKTPAFHVFAC